MDNDAGNENRTYFWKWVKQKSAFLTFFGLAQLALFLVLYASARERIRTAPGPRIHQIEIDECSALAGGSTTGGNAPFFHGNLPGNSLAPVFLPAMYRRSQATAENEVFGTLVGASSVFATLAGTAPETQPNQDLAGLPNQFPEAWSGDMEEMDLGDDLANSPGLADDPAQAASSLYVAPNPARIILKPVPEPDTLALVLTGAALTGWRCWRDTKRRPPQSKRI